MKTTDLTPDPANPNLGTDRGRALVKWSVETFGYVRPVLLDGDDVIIAGNKTTGASDASVLIVDIEPDEILVHIRDDLDVTTPEGRMASRADNRTSEVGLAWDEPMLAADYRQPILELSPYWREPEIEAMDLAGADDKTVDDRAFWPEISYRMPKHLYDLLWSKMKQYDGDDSTQFDTVLHSL